MAPASALRRLKLRSPQQPLLLTQTLVPHKRVNVRLVGHGDYLWWMSGARRERPLRRRAVSTARPPVVFIRARKPWVRFRLILLGWYVRFMTLT